LIFRIVSLRHQIDAFPSIVKTNFTYPALAVALAITAFAQEKNSQAVSPAELNKRAIHRLPSVKRVE